MRRLKVARQKGQLILVPFARNTGWVNPADIARWRTKLLTLKTEIMEEGDIAIEPTRKDDATSGDDEDEQPHIEMSQVIASKRNRERTDALARIRQALQRLDEAPQDFGSCTECGEPIGRRLEAMPYVELCLECQNELDAQKVKLGRRRHVTDYR